MNSFLRRVLTRSKKQSHLETEKLTSFEVEKGGGTSMIDEHITAIDCTFTLVPKATSSRVLSAILQQVAHVSLDLLSHIVCVTAWQRAQSPCFTDAKWLSFCHTSFVLVLPPGNQSKQSTEIVLTETFCIVQALVMCEYSPRSFISWYQLFFDDFVLKTI